jgi:DNA-binding response OmpR family regulator
VGRSLGHFLVVEDDVVVRQAIARAAAGVMDVRFAPDGLAALQALDGAGADLPRFILLDFGLPDLDGIEVLRQLRRRPDCEAVPILMFSSLEDPVRTAQALAAGAMDWVTKPVEPAAMRQRVQEICHRWGGASPQVN